MTEPSAPGTDATSGLPPEAFAAALAGLPGMGPARLAAVLRRWPPDEAWRAVSEGAAVDDPEVRSVCRPDGSRAMGAVWQRAASVTDVSVIWKAHLDAGVSVHLPGRPGYPPLLASDHHAPAVLFSAGNMAALGNRRVAIVGTRRCTRYGRDIAYELGRDLSAAGVAIVSGLALGVDGAAHAGALEAGGGRPVAVVGSGLDIVYPRRHRALWASVVERGVVISESPLGTAPEAWRFPIRNRIIAAVSEVVVVVESPMKGGSHHTVMAAETRGIPVMAVPGPVRSVNSEYPNALLADGCHPVRDALDVTVALNLTTSRQPASVDRRPAPAAADLGVFETLGWEPASLEEIVRRSGRSPAEVSVALAHLERDGWVEGHAGWWERIA